jgi:hypothetical protein
MILNTNSHSIIFVLVVAFLVYLTEAGTARLRIRRQNPVIKVGLGALRQIVGPLNPFEIVFDEDDGKVADEIDEDSNDMSYSHEYEFSLSMSLPEVPPPPTPAQTRVIPNESPKGVRNRFRNKLANEPRKRI